MIYGDASQNVVLEAAQVERACLVLITTPALIVTQTIAERVHRLNPDVHIVRRPASVEGCASSPRRL